MGFLCDNVFKNKMYMTISTLSLAQLLIVILSFTIENDIAFIDDAQKANATIIGAILGASSFLYNCLLPLKMVTY